MAIATKQNEQAYTGFLTALRLLRGLNNEMPAQQMDILVSIARRPGLTMAELSDDVGLAQSSCSRNVAALSKYHRLGKAGYNLVETVSDPREPRRKLIFLTGEGKVFITKLLRSIQPEFSYDKDTDARVEVERMHATEMQKREAVEAEAKAERSRYSGRKIHVPN